MTSLYSLAALLSLALLVNCIDARKDSGEYWRQSHDLTDDRHAKPRLVQGHVHVAKVTSVSDDKKGDCKHDSVEPSLAKYKQLLTSDFEARPSATAYVNDLKPNDEQSYTKDFEPRPNISFYNNDVKQEDGKSLVTDFEPRPNISAYDNNDVKQEDGKSLVTDFEPRPNISAYDDHATAAEATEEIEKGLVDGKNYKI